MAEKAVIKISMLLLIPSKAFSRVAECVILQPQSAESLSPKFHLRRYLLAGRCRNLPGAYHSSFNFRSWVYPVSCRNFQVHRLLSDIKMTVDIFRFSKNMPLQYRSWVKLYFFTRSYIFLKKWRIFVHKYLQIANFKIIC